jgi:pantoate--beta-alanine ligase
MLYNKPQKLRAYFGKKDAQQLILIELMVKDYFLNVEIVPCEIVRDSDGLALSSRNLYLKSKERVEALAISRSLKRASKLVMQNILDRDSIVKEMREVMKGIEIEYIAIVNREFKEIDRVEITNTIILVASKVGGVRLIDNIWI